MQIATTFSHAILLVYAALFPVINPIGGAPVFLNFTRFCAPAQRYALARKVAVSSFLLLLGSMFIGSHVLSFFGIKLPVVQIGGGIIVMALAWKLLNAPTAPHFSEAGPTPSPIVPEVFYPLTLPLTVDPGALSVAVTIGSHHPEAATIERLLLLASSAITGLLAISLTIYLCYRFAENLVTLLGHDGMRVIIRLSSFILFCIGIQILWTGWYELAHSSL
ncbi:MAG TPA: MarC family protein [Rhizomicrobium sp.]|nr:MarC family protein [Rhizomicrobium sp.]